MKIIVDLKETKCPICNEGYLEEWSLMDDIDKKVTCTNYSRCGRQLNRYVDREEVKKT